jgi:hypothetical protein
MEAFKQTSLAASGPMFSDDFSLQLQILVGITVPPILTAACWLIGRRVARSSGGAAGNRVLVDAHCRLCDLPLGLAGSQFLARHERADPTSLLVQ